mmetsp:Transcript_12151/g.15750  ORF Transcript_12151/g.15750 Transcript_12151/m.15750 type:complete len:356 (+) Transcript_12151:43-1110(+)
MGLCSFKCLGPTPEFLRNLQISEELRAYRRSRSRFLSFILFGLPGSGKSTFLSQFMFHSGKQADFEEGKINVQMNIILWMQQLVREDVNHNANCPDEVEELLSWTSVRQLDKSDISTLKVIWQDSSVQNLWKNRYKYNLQVEDSLEYLMDLVDKVDFQNIGGVGDPLYLRLRRKPENSVKISQSRVSAIDAEFNEFPAVARSLKPIKHLGILDDVPVIYLIDSSAYDQKVSINGDLVYVHEQAAEDIVALSASTRMTALILVFTKMDILFDKFPKVPFKLESDWDEDRNLDFHGNTSADAVEYLFNKMATLPGVDSAVVYRFDLTLTDTMSCERSFSAMCEIGFRAIWMRDWVFI